MKVDIYTLISDSFNEYFLCGNGLLKERKKHVIFMSNLFTEHYSR